jgi:hypothetical protein
MLHRIDDLPPTFSSWSLSRERGKPSKRSGRSFVWWYELSECNVSAPPPKLRASLAAYTIPQINIKCAKQNKNKNDGRKQTKKPKVAITPIERGYVTSRLPTLYVPSNHRSAPVNEPPLTVIPFPTNTWCLFAGGDGGFHAQLSMGFLGWGWRWLYCLKETRWWANFADCAEEFVCENFNGPDDWSRVAYWACFGIK